MKRKILVCVLAVAMLITMLAGCGTTNSTGDKDKTTTKPVKDTVTYALFGDITLLDQIKNASSIDRFVYCNCYNTLVKRKPDGSLNPELAESWTASDDGLTYTFKLVKGVKFHNGEELKASDVVFTIKKAQASPFTAGTLTQLKEVAAVDDYTVKFTLNQPYAPFLLCAADIFIQNEKAVKEAGDNYGKDNLVGTGPYKFVKHETGQSVTLERFDDYFKGKTAIKNVVYKIITDQNAAFIALQSGEVDLATSLNATSIKSAKNNANLALHQYTGSNLFYILINDAKYNNVKLRQAINYAIDKDSVVVMSAEGLAQKADTFVNDQTFGYSKDVKGYEYNPEKAKQLLTEAGYPNGLKLTLKTLEQLKKVAEVVQENLGKIGITVNMETQDQATVISDVMNGNYEIATFGCSMLLDVDGWYDIFHSKGGMNLGKYSNPRIDELFDQARKSIDTNERLKLYKELLQTISDDAAIVPVYFPVSTVACNKDLDIKEVSTGYLFVEDMSWKK